jgi:hypothetical protein
MEDDAAAVAGLNAATERAERLLISQRPSILSMFIVMACLLLFCLHWQFHGDHTALYRCVFSNVQQRRYCRSLCRVPLLPLPRVHLT